MKAETKQKNQEVRKNIIIGLAKGIKGVVFVLFAIGILLSVYVYFFQHHRYLIYTDTTHEGHEVKIYQEGGLSPLPPRYTDLVFKVDGKTVLKFEVESLYHSGEWLYEDRIHCEQNTESEYELYFYSAEEPRENTMHCITKFKADFSELIYLEAYGLAYVDESCELITYERLFGPPF